MCFSCKNGEKSTFLWFFRLFFLSNLLRIVCAYFETSKLCVIKEGVSNREHDHLHVYMQRLFDDDKTCHWNLKGSKKNYINNASVSQPLHEPWWSCFFSFFLWPLKCTKRGKFIAIKNLTKFRPFSNWTVHCENYRDSGLHT